MGNRNFMEEVKAAVNGKWFRSKHKPKRKKRMTAWEICMDELHKEG